MKRKPTKKEKIAMYERFLHKINMCMTCVDHDAIRELVDNANMWSYMHRVGNGELSDKQQDKLIHKAFWRLCDTPKADELTKERQRMYSEKKAERDALTATAVSRDPGSH